LASTKLFSSSGDDEDANSLIGGFWRWMGRERRHIEISLLMRLVVEDCALRDRLTLLNGRSPTPRSMGFFYGQAHC
jgi:hypothetical protein